MARRIEIKPNDRGGLAFEVGVIGAHIALQTMRLKAGFLPHFVDHRLADAEFPRQLAAGPMSGAVAGLAAGGVENPRPQPGRELRGRLAGALGFQPVETVL